jgi:predicted NAD-dependent protein-ADP-ribosyltransferase YbiA (DUF1768 family)
MDTCSYFIENKALFGSMPNNETIKDLEKIGVKYFIDLTSPKENQLSVYQTRHNILRYPIPDRKHPNDMESFSCFVYRIFHIIKNLKEGQKIYIHCKGGHGRSGIVVACLLCLYLKIPPEVALDLTKFYHQQRLSMRDKWRRIGSPQTFAQKMFVKKLFEPLYFNTYINPYFCNSYPCSIVVENFGTFLNVEAAYQAMKNTSDKQYVTFLSTCSSIREIKNAGKRITLRGDWENIKDDIMYSLLRIKFDTHEELKTRLLQTCLRPIVFKSAENTYWKSKTHNRLGKLIQKIRGEYYLK